MNSTKPTKTSPPKRLLFDRRYGWVFDEWKDPSEEALAGGRGMFCILPLAKAFMEIASQSVGSLVKAIEQPDQFSPQTLKTNLSDQFQKLMCSVQRPDLNLLALKGNSSILSVGWFKHMHQESSDSRNN